MTKLKLISSIAIGLLIGNLLLIAFLFLNKPKPPRHEGPKAIIIERLHFDAKQIEAYEALIKVHRKQISEKEIEILNLKTSLYSSIVEPYKIAQKDYLEKKLAELQIEIEEIHYKHFLDIKKLCHDDQLNNFNELIKDIAGLFSKPKPSAR
ncbi:hypothetical protein [Aurantibacillus circumpalustris]|uniref:hypothetical protein n=1 Tax=Aurantibacillus circumpalustris TaxID=3036359 RepID=UPI00295B1CCC|nr:hypothetical protein [Aurantibacillus circumpalustris]